MPPRPAASPERGVIVCKTSASGVSNGGYKYVTVSVAGRGSSRPGVANDTYWYIDAWSARTTWGGAAPPAGCGDYSADRLCTESIVIPEGQVVLLDVSPPRFFLILVEGTLIFDRRDLHLQAHYILLRGGTLQIGTEYEPFMQDAQITLFGHPKSIELPTFGSKVLACYRCTLDIHGAPQKTWTQLSATAQVGDFAIQVTDSVAWRVGSRIVIATTDFESPLSSHSEVATVSSVSADGRTVYLSDLSVCSTMDFSGTATDCVSGGSGLRYPHLGETKVFDGRPVSFRAEVGLLTRNVRVIGDHDSVLCPLPETADDGKTLLSCNQFGAQLFFHSPGHESLTVRMSHMEIANGGQAFRLGRYAVHWHMIGNVRNSFQRDCSIHHSWNRGTAVHGTNHLRLQSNFIYQIMGHSFFIEDGTEEGNRVEDNLGIKTVPSMNLLNTDQTPAVFWIVTMNNYILRNHAVASRRYGIWLRPEVSVTGTSVNTPVEVHPINIPVLQIEGNVVHSNGKYGLRVFDVYLPKDPSVIKDLFTWRNGKAGFTATVIGRIGFDGVISAQQGDVVFESRETQVDRWDVAYIRNGLFIDYTGLPLAKSYAMTSDEFDDLHEMGGPQGGGLLFPWNTNALGGFSVANITFVNFKNACLRGCAHCGRGGSPFFGDGAFETRFSGMRFVNSSQRALFRHPNEAFFYDMDGTLTDTFIKETYTKGGTVRGSSFVGISPLRPPEKCEPSLMSTQGTGGAVCQGLIFRRSWYKIATPTEWVGKNLCVRPHWQSTIDYCHDLGPTCNCLPWLKKMWMGNVWLAAEGYRYNLQLDLQPYELADPVKWSQNVWATKVGERFQFTQRFIQFRANDGYGRNLMWTRLGNNQDWGLNWAYNASSCTEGIGCGTIQQNDAYAPVVTDSRAIYTAGVGASGNLAVPSMLSSKDRSWTFQKDADGNGGQYTHQINGIDGHQSYDVTVEQCPRAGCWPPPPPPPPPPPDTTLVKWSDPYAWLNLTTSVLNPHNKIKYVKNRDGSVDATVRESQVWAASVPGEFENVWIPSWRRVVLDVAKTPVLGHLIVEGVLVINSTQSVELTVTYLEIRGGTVLIATADANSTAVGDFEGRCTIKLVGTNSRLRAIHGGPRETPQIARGKQGVVQASGMIGVFGTLIARGKKVSDAWALLERTAPAGGWNVTLDRVVDWQTGSEIMVAPTRFNMHESETRSVVSTQVVGGKTLLVLDRPLDFQHYADSASNRYGSKEMRMQGEVALLTRNIVITGDGEGERGVGGVTYGYTSWNSQEPPVGSSASCGNSVCEIAEDSKTCPADCRGPADEYGAAVAVLGYDEEYVACSRDGACVPGYQRTFKGTAFLSDVELRYFGQNSLRAGFTQDGAAGNFTLERVSFNRGYFQAVDIKGGAGGTVKGCVMYRSMLPALRIAPSVTSARIEGNLAAIGIFWNTHRGAFQGKGLDRPKRDAMVGMYDDQGLATVMLGNRAAGSERAGFMGAGKPCGMRGVWEGNEVHSSLAGFWFDHYSPMTGCREIYGLTAWRIWLYGIHAETAVVSQVSITGYKAADVRGAGVEVMMIGGSSLDHELVDRRVKVSDSLLVGASQNAGECGDTSDVPGMWTCTFYMAWCKHLGDAGRSGIVIPNFLSGANMAPKIKPWNDAGSYPSLLGRTDTDKVTYAYFEARCQKVDSAVRANFNAADANHPLYSTRAETVRVDVGTSTVALFRSNARWISQDDCIDMDCDGPRNSLVRDDDGTLFSTTALSSSKGAAISRGDFFNQGSFFGIKYNDPMNIPAQPWWYPNLPSVMRTDSTGNPVNVTASWLRNGYGIPRQGCSLSGDGWICPQIPTTKSYRMLVVESMDEDHEIRRISPVAFSSDDGYTQLTNGCMDHGWCFSYTCLKRLMTFWTIVAVNQPYTVHFTGTEPQGMRISLLHAPSTEGVILRVYYTRSLRLQVFVGGVYAEDVNMAGGKFKSQLFKDGKLPPNNVESGGWKDQAVSLDCACKVGDRCLAALGQSPYCEKPSNLHGASTFVRSSGMLEVVVMGHSVDQFVEIRAMPVVQVSMGVSTSVDDFYKIKDSFVSNLASLLGIAPARLNIVDVVAGNARRAIWGSHQGPRRQLQSTTVNFEIEPDATIEAGSAQESVNETAGSIRLKIVRKTNIMASCSVAYAVWNASGSTALPSVDFTPSSGVATFASTVTEVYVTVPIAYKAAFGPDVTFVLLLSKPVNATIGATSASVVTIKNVNPPAPTAPVSSSSSLGSVGMSWAAPMWTSAPSGDDGAIAGYDLQCKVGNEAWDSAVRYTQTNASVTGLATYSRVACKVRAVTVSGGVGEYSPQGSDAFSSAVCGDSNRQGSEGCDDGNTAAGDGCSAACVVESGSSCQMNGAGLDTCASGCGDGNMDVSEGCDDGNLASNDGCSSACAVEIGWVCTGSKSVCTTRCGDAVRSGPEDCDDGNNVTNDGCSAACVVESGNGWSCSEAASSGKRSSCRKCGNGVLEVGEVCDDSANTAGCVSSCGVVAAGWLCSGAGVDSCIGGPGTPQPPAGTGGQGQVAWAWGEPDGRGLAITAYTLEWRRTGASDAEPVVKQTTRSYVAVGLAADTVWEARVKACTTAGCKWSAWSPSSGTLVPASSALADIGKSVEVAATSGSLGVNVTGTLAEFPPAVPDGPSASSLAGALTQEQINQLADNLDHTKDPTTALSVIAEQVVVNGGQPISLTVGVAATSQTVVATRLAVTITANIALASSPTSPLNLPVASSVRWTITAKTAIPGLDFSGPLSGTLQFATGQVSASIVVPLIANPVYSGFPRSFTLSLSSPSDLGAGFALSLHPSLAAVVVTITDGKGPITVQFSRSEVRGSATIGVPVIRGDAWKELAARIVFETYDATAKASLDYVPQAAGTATFAAGAVTASVRVSTVVLGKVGAAFGVRAVRVETECIPGSGVFACSGTIGLTSQCSVVIEGGCGNGLRGTGEACDDGNTIPLDGCSALCEVEPGYKCAGGDSGAQADVCTLPSAPPVGSEVVKVTARLVGITVEKFQSDAAVRQGFVDAVASTLGVSSTQVAIESVAIRRQSASGVSVRFRVTVPAGSGGKVAQAVSDSARGGSLATALKARGIEVTVEFVGQPSVTDASGVEKALDEINSEANTNINTIIAAVVGSVVSVGVIVCCFVAGIRYVRRREASAPAEAGPESKISPGEGGGTPPPPAGGDGKAKETPDLEAGGAAEQDRAFGAFTGGEMGLLGTLVGGDGGKRNHAEAQAERTRQIVLKEITAALKRDWVTVCDKMFEAGSRYATLPDLVGLLTESCVGISPAHVDKLWPTLEQKEDGTVDVLKELLEKSASNDMEQNLLVFFSCLPLINGSRVAVGLLRGALTGVFAPAAVDRLLLNAVGTISFGEFVAEARAYATESNQLERNHPSNQLSGSHLKPLGGLSAGLDSLVPRRKTCKLASFSPVQAA